MEPIPGAVPSAPTKTISIPEAGKLFFGISKNAAYAAAERGEIPWIRVGRLKRVPVALMERRLQQADSK
jgi:hypothetical protein